MWRGMVGGPLVEADIAGQLEMACKGYAGGLRYLEAYLLLETDADLKNAVQAKVAQYKVRLQRLNDVMAGVRPQQQQQQQQKPQAKLSALQSQPNRTPLRVMSNIKGTINTAALGVKTVGQRKGPLPPRKITINRTKSSSLPSTTSPACALTTPAPIFSTSEAATSDAAPTKPEVARHKDNTPVSSQREEDGEAVWPYGTNEEELNEVEDVTKIAGERREGAEHLGKSPMEEQKVEVCASSSVDESTENATIDTIVDAAATAEVLAATRRSEELVEVLSRALNDAEKHVKHQQQERMAVSHVRGGRIVDHAENKDVQDGDYCSGGDVGLLWTGDGAIGSMGVTWEGGDGDGDERTFQGEVGGFGWTQWVTDSLTSLDKTAAKTWVPAVDGLYKISKRAIEEEWNAQFPPDEIYQKEISLNKNYPSELRVRSDGYLLNVPSLEQERPKAQGKRA